MTNTYKTLLAESPEYIVCAHGKSGQIALGFRGDYATIEKAWFLFLNYDKTCVLHHISDNLCYISTTLPRIKAAIRLFLYVNILHSQEIKSSWDEETNELTQDTEKATQLAMEDTEHFMANLKTESFIPTYESTEAFEYNEPFGVAA